MSKHTPGPWTLNGFYIEFDAATRIATASNWRMSGVDAHAEAKANARLIAAAPDLLEVLEQFVAWVDAPSESAFSDSQLAAARAAIAKAKGEQA